MIPEGVPDTAIEASAPVRPRGEPARFVSGSVLRHILITTGAGAAGLMALFAGDLANIYFLSRLQDEAIVAAIGYASSILFFSISIGIGLSIAAAALVSPAIGAGRRVRARRLSVHAHVLTVLISALLSLFLWLWSGDLLEALGATGRTYTLAGRYLDILLPTLPLLACAMTSASVLRSVGDARRAMNVTLYGAIANTALDILFILHMGWGIEGAAIASAISRAAIAGVGLYGVVRVHNLMGRPKLPALKRDWRPFCQIAVPAILTNIATPAANAYVTRALAPFGDDAVSGWAIIGRILPVAFGAIYALSGSVGPILGQNFGAKLPERLEEVFTKALYVTIAFTATAWLVLALSADFLAGAFHAKGDARAIIVLFCRWLSPLFLFLGLMFVANAAFNVLGKPHYALTLNWARATIGLVPFVMIGAAHSGAAGVLIANMLSGIPFGVIAVWLGYRLIASLTVKDRPGPAPPMLRSGKT